MDKVLVDTNIVLDLLAKREDFYVEAQELFTLSDRGKIKLFVSALTLANTHYILSKHYSPNDARKILGKFKILAKTLPLDDKVIDLALVSDFTDFEDAIQYHSAQQSSLNYIITRNKKDFKTSKIPVFTAKEYVTRFKNE
ncbi:PIN domain-containing protein [Bacteroides sp. 51]|uniref:type II toxin-antitoxin system VapC family toxin n=1 Tax=Bacteroides sp. 51 TaxID=2302938 RepID=UPI0013D684BD|nr:PIN domain-containing protein [Bacteroides sp. 51]NDV83267.1 PIN domain-containing protein [Bacteroides sp. 51]